MGRIKYMPVVIVGLSVALFFLAFQPLVNAFSAFLPAGLATLVAAIVVLTPTLFVLGLNARKKVFMFLIFVILGVLLIGFFAGMFGL